MAKAKQKQTTRNALTVAIEQAVDNTPLEMVPLELPEEEYLTADVRLSPEIAETKSEPLAVNHNIAA